MRLRLIAQARLAATCDNAPRDMQHNSYWSVLRTSKIVALPFRSSVGDFSEGAMMGLTLYEQAGRNWVSAGCRKKHHEWPLMGAMVGLSLTPSPAETDSLPSALAYDATCRKKDGWMQAHAAQAHRYSRLP
jgi:hypothetical protein